MDYVSDLDTPLLQLSPTDKFTLRDAVQGVHIFGGIGSGKTSGSGKALASAYLRAGFGGLVLAAKPDEVELWCQYARENGRENSVVIFGDRGGGGFNFITYELARQGAQGLGSVVECLMRILDAARQTNPNAGRSGDPFWEDATRQVLRNTLPVLYAATGQVTIPDIIRFLATAPKSDEQIHDATWQDRSFMFAALKHARKSPALMLHPDIYRHEAELDKAGDYWRDEWSGLNEKTRTNIGISVSATLDKFNRGRLHDAFCTATSIVPEMTFHGAIIIMAMPALTWNEDGIIAQHLFKFMYERAVLSRNSLAPQHRDRPVFLWADESQYFVNAFDTDYQSTCRSSKACSVFLTQSLPGYYAKIGGDNSKHKADMLLANFVTKIFHNNADPETNRWASETIGKSIQRRRTYSEGENFGTNQGMNTGDSRNWGTNSSSSSSVDHQGNVSHSYSSGSSAGGGESWGRNRGMNSGQSVSGGYNEAMDFEVEAAEFSRALRTGGKSNNMEVTGIWFQAGKNFTDSGRNYLYTRFQQ